MPLSGAGRRKQPRAGVFQGPVRPVTKSKINIFIRRHCQSAFVIYPTIQYTSHTDPDLHHEVAVHPKLHSLLVRPLGLTAGEMYNVGEIYIKPHPTPP